LAPSTGFWRAGSSSTAFHQCPSIAACPGLPMNNSRDQQCREGHTGVRCETCAGAQGFTRRVDRLCSRCTDMEVTWTAIGLALLVLVPVCVCCLWRCAIRPILCMLMGCNPTELSRRLRDNYHARAIKFRILVNFTQVVSRIPVTYRLKFPPNVIAFLSALDFFELLNVFHFIFVPNCFYHLDYYQQLMSQVLLPTAVLIISFAGFRIGKCQWAHEVFLLLSYVAYPALCDSLFRFFDCKVTQSGFFSISLLFWFLQHTNAYSLFL
jgi:hypothetical protein